MGFTAIEIVNMLFQHPVLTYVFADAKKPNGKLCKLSRPDNSKLEDIVINIVGNVKDDIDEAVLNVNQFVPNLVYPDDPGNKSQPNMARLLYLSKLINDAFQDGEELWNDAGEYCFKYQQDTVMEDENNQHYLNFRIEFYSSI